MTVLHYEKFEVGRTTEHEKRHTVSGSDNQHFCNMAMDQQPLHLDAEFAANSQLGERLANNLYTTSLAVGLSAPDTTDETIVVNPSHDDVFHPGPMFHGDTLRAQTIVLDKRETSGDERGVVVMKVEAFNQDDDLVCELERTALSLKRELAADADDA